MSNRSTNIIAICLLTFVFFAAVFSVKDDSLTMDELAHLPAGYSYLTQKDMRLNPEHPPLVKDLAAIPLLFIKGINFPSQIKDWEEDVNGQWGFGNVFLFNSGNPAGQMIFWGRLPMILLLVLLGFYIFKWTKEIFGNETALLALFLFSFSPTFLAHGRLVTTDVGAAAGVFIATYYFLKALRNPSKKHIVFAGIAFGAAELLKFSLILLIPFFVFLAFVSWLANPVRDLSLIGAKTNKLKEAAKILIAVFILGFILVGAVYQYHVFDYPPEKQASDAAFILNSFPGSLADLTVWTADKPVLRAYGQYILGVLMVIQRASGGNTTYFLGEVSATGWKNYFPVVYFMKKPLGFHILTIICLLYAAWLVKKPLWRDAFSRLKEWIKTHFPEFAMLSFIALYWTTSLTSNLNIGVRHLLPVFPFTILLVSAGVIAWLKPPGFKRIKYVILFGLLVFQIVSVLKTYPYFLAYFNEAAGGPDNGYIYTVDSNLDWGQDLKRLKNWTDENNVGTIYVDYFGGSDTKYYLGEKYLPWRGTRNRDELPPGSYLAISATFLQGGRGKPSPGFNQDYGYYQWLDGYKPVAKIGYSIFVYKF